MLARDIHDEDTVELQLTPAQLAGLTQAAAEATAVPVPVPLPKPVTRNRRRRTFTVGMTALVVALAVAVTVAHRPRAPATQPALSPPPAAPVRAPAPPPRGRSLVAAQRAATEPAPAPPPVKFRNPFDRSEVFEFPAGTSYEDARGQVAQLLLDRARVRNGLEALPAATVEAKARPLPNGARSETGLARGL